MDRYVYERLRDICPDEDISSKSIEDLVKDCRIAFSIIGYEYSKNLEDTVKVAYENANKHSRLFSFIYKVWRED